MIAAMVSLRIVIAKPRSLEAVLDCELHDPRITGLCIDLSECSRVEANVRVAPVEIVKEVERLNPQLHGSARAERQDARDGYIDLPESGSFNRSRRFVAERAGRWNGERLRVEKVQQGLVAVRIVGNLIDALRRDAVERPVLRRRDGEPVTGVRIQNPGHPPIRRDYTQSAVAELGGLRARVDVRNLALIVWAITAIVGWVTWFQPCGVELHKIAGDGSVRGAMRHSVVAAEAQAVGGAALD